MIWLSSTIGWEVQVFIWPANITLTTPQNKKKNIILAIYFIICYKSV